MIDLFQRTDIMSGCNVLKFVVIVKIIVDSI